MSETLRQTLIHKVIRITHLNEKSYTLRFSRCNMKFTPGQHICVGPHNDLNMREYSIYSGVSDDCLEILVREVPKGYISVLLKQLKEGDEIKVEGPYGYFVIEEEERTRPLYGVATGTGIAPFHCFALSHPELQFTVLHGIRNNNEQYNHEVFENSKYSYIPCVSRDTQHKHYQGRVTDYLKQSTIDTTATYFLCGNCDMIYEVFDILQSTGVPPKHIKAEVYF